MTDEDLLLTRARAFLDAVMPVLEVRCANAPDEPITVPGFPIWVPDADFGVGMRRFKAVPREFSGPQQCAIRVLGELRAEGLPALSGLEETLAADPVIGPRLRGDSVISGAGGGAWQAPSLVQILVDRVISRANGFTVGLDQDALAAQWTAMLRRDADRITVVAALHEFDAPTAPVAVEKGLEIVKLTEEEIAAALSLGGGLRSLSLDERMVSDTYAIRTAFDSRLYVDDVPAGERDQEQATAQGAEKIVGLLVLALRVFKAGRVRVSGTFRYVTSQWGEVSPNQGSIGPMFGWHSPQPYVLAGDEVASFCDFWSEFKKGRNDGVIESALRRFSFAAERSLPEDEVVDLMIAAESLFLTETATRDRGELRYRLAIRVAGLLGTTVEERMRIWKFMRTAYDARSVIVHGGTPKAKGIRNLNDEQVQIDVFADELEAVLRRALQVAIHRRAQGESFPPNWEEVIFAGPVDLSAAQTSN